MNERNRNSGVTGAVDVQGGPSFTGSVFAWKRRRDANTRNIRPRGDSWFLPRSLGEGATLLISFTVRVDGYFEPTTLENATGTVTTQLHTGRTVAYAVRFTSCWLEFNEKEDKWFGTVGASVVSAPTSTWAGTQTVPSAPASVTENETPDGVTGKVLDPQNLQESSTTVLDLYGLADTDAAEVTRLESYFLRAVPVTGHKVRSVSIVRQGRWGATITIQHGLRDTEDDVEMPGTVYSVDPSDLQSSTSVTVVEDDATPDGGVSVSGQVLRSTTKRQLHDSKWAITYNFAETTTEDDVEFAGTITVDDPDNLVDSATVRVVNSSSTYPGSLDTPPAGLKLRGVSSQQLTNGDKWQHTAQYGRRDTEDDVEMEGTAYEVDSVHSDLGFIFGQVQIRVVQADATISWPSTPTQPADLKQGKVNKVQLHDSKWALTYNFVRSTSEDAIEIEGTRTGADPDDLGETARITLVTNSSTPPGDPGAPVGVLVATETRPLTRANGSYTGYWVHTYEYGPTTRLQSIEFDADYVVDANSTTRGISNSHVIKTINGSSTPPAEPTGSKLDANLKLVRRSTRRVQGTAEKWLHVWEYGRNTSEDNAEHTQRTIDPNDLGEIEKIPLLHTSATSSPGTPSQEGTTALLIRTEVERVCVANSGFTGLWLWTFTFGPLTRIQEIEFAGVRTTDTESNMIDQHTVIVVDPDSDASNVIEAPTDTALQLHHVDSRRIQGTPVMWEHRYDYRRNTVADEIQLNGTVERQNEGDNIAEFATATLIGASATPPSAPAATVGKHIGTESQQIYTASGAYTGRWRHKFLYGHNTAIDEIELEGEYEDDRSTVEINSQDVQTDVTTSATPPAAPATRIADLKHIRTSSRKIQDTPARWRHRFIFGRNTQQDEIETGGTVTENNVDDLFEEATITQVTASATPPADPGTPNAAVLDDTRTRQLSVASGGYAGAWAHTFIYRPNTRKQGIERGGTVLTTDAEQGDRDTTTTVETIASYSPATLDGVRDTFVTNNIGTATFDSVSVRQLTATKAEVRLMTKSSSIFLLENIVTDYETRASRAGAVMVTWSRQEDVARWRARVIPQNILVTKGIVRIRRTVIGTSRAAVFSLADTTYYSGKVGLMNNAVFLGFPVKALLYLGWEASQDYGRNGTNHKIDIDFRFKLDSIGHYNDEQIDTRSDFVFANSAPTIGLNVASRFGWTVTEPAVTDYTPFIT